MSDRWPVPTGKTPFGVPFKTQVLTPAYALRKRTTDAAYWATQGLVEATWSGPQAR
jgi:hypothetical protein